MSWMKYYSRQPFPKKKTRSKRWLFLIIPVIVIGGILYWFFAGGREVFAPEASNSSVQQSEEQSTPSYSAIDLQPTIDTWVAKQAADYYIEVYDAQANKTIAKNSPEKVLFAASLYKIYVAYLALLDIQNGDMNPDEVISGSFTRKQCIDKMIRESHSPCGEAMMADMGTTNLNRRVSEMGMTGTFFNGIRTSAADSALILRYIEEHRDLNDENTAYLRDAMLTQDAKYKRGLQTGAPEAKWETKVGWNEDINYHDIGIMTMPDGRVFYVAILSQGQGSSAPIADFSKTIFSALAL
jgi:beta-lactamase class A